MGFSISASNAWPCARRASRYRENEHHSFSILREGPTNFKEKSREELKIKTCINCKTTYDSTKIYCDRCHTILTLEDAQKLEKHQKQEKFEFAIKLLKAMKKIDTIEGLNYEESVNLLKDELLN